MRAQMLVACLAGGVEALLLARLILRLLAARPDHPVVWALLAVTAPLHAPLARLDAAQPRFGSSLEFSTLALILLIPIAGALLALALARKS